MTVKLVVTAGPHAGKEFDFDGHDTFLVGRSKDAHFQLSRDDPYFSRRHFLVEVNPPRVRVFDLNSRNGIAVNGAKVRTADLNDGDELKAGHTVFRVTVPSAVPDEYVTIAGPASPPKPPVTPSATADEPESVPDGLVPGYRLESELGRGGMGIVYRAKRESDGQPVAVKVITPAEGVPRRHVEKFLREARILAELDHRNVVRYLDSGEGDGVVYLVMELVEGTDAARLVKKQGPLDVATAVRLAVHALAGLAHAHAKGYVHRDVKPANLLLGKVQGTQVVKVADFGLARTYDDCGMSGLTMHGDIGGTPAFMAPEQVTHYRDAKPAADQYAAAASLYYLLTGKYVLDLHPDIRNQLVQIVTEPRTPIRTHCPDTPEPLAAVLDRALAMEPTDRYPDVAAFRKALGPFTK